MCRSFEHISLTPTAQFFTPRSGDSVLFSLLKFLQHSSSLTEAVHTWLPYVTHLPRYLARTRQGKQRFTISTTDVDIGTDISLVGVSPDTYITP
jgi:hypothetical protein